MGDVFRANGEEEDLRERESPASVHRVVDQGNGFISESEREKVVGTLDFVRAKTAHVTRAFFLFLFIYLLYLKKKHRM